MKNMHMYIVRTQLPAEIENLRKLAYNLWWTWNPEAANLFSRFDRNIQSDLTYNPCKMLSYSKSAHIQEMMKNESFMSELTRIQEQLQSYLQRPTWTDQAYPDFKKSLVAYFSFEFGLHTCLPIYSGGLGILAGDHLKSASDLGLPLIGVSLLYKNGYLKQALNREGWQLETYNNNDFYHMPIDLCYKNNKPVVISVELLDQVVYAQIWKAEVGRVQLYLLDANIPQNPPKFRALTEYLYGGDEEMRIQQEILLGIGGYRALLALGLEPAVTHMNEGHAAFLGLERIKILMKEKDLNFAQAVEYVKATNVFTTHTPVEAGNDWFSVKMLLPYFKSFIKDMNLTDTEFLNLGRMLDPDPKKIDENQPFGMTVLAIKLATSRNGVSALHGQVSRKMWQNIWPELPVREIPIGSVTNGIHFNTWIAPEIRQLYDRYLGPDWTKKPEDQKVWERVEEIPNTELWQTHELRRQRMIAMVRGRLREQLKQKGVPKIEIDAADEILNPDALTIGFARRFVPYKRSYLLFQDLERLKKILNNTERPVQIIFSGKAHPRNTEGKEMIKAVYLYSRRPEFRRNVVFIEDYDINIARYLVSGVDVWLNNPRRPLEASGTSGMKVCFNGGLHFSVLDGWWPEAVQEGNGFTIGTGEEYDDPKYQDMIEGQSIYDMLEHEIAPIFYKRGADKLPKDWIKMMKRSISTICPIFNTNRMVREYAEKFYIPGSRNAVSFKDNNFETCKKIIEWKNKVTRNWPTIKVHSVDYDINRDIKTGDDLGVKIKLSSGELGPEDLCVEIVYGVVEPDSEQMEYWSTEEITHCQQIEPGKFLYEGIIPCKNPGQNAFKVRIIPKNKLMTEKFWPGYLIWS